MFAVLARGPDTYLAELGGGCSIGFLKKAVAVIPHPLGKLVRTCVDLSGNFIDAEYLFGMIILYYPFPESRAEIQTVMEIPGLDEHIRIEEVGHSITPSSRAAS
jgi:hypothetical protein